MDGGFELSPLKRAFEPTSRSGDARVQPVVDERAQGPQPGFVATPARDGGAIDRLPSLPLAGSFHSARIAFGVQARVVPRQAAGRDDPPDHWFGRESGPRNLPR